MPGTDIAIAAPDGLVLRATAFDHPSPRAAVVVVHGMGEHRRRYDRFCDRLNKEGFASISYDQRAHGETAEQHGRIGPGGFSAMVRDIDVVRQTASDRYGKPVIVMGHSMGSFASQMYVLDHHEKIAGLALSGTTAADVMAAHRDPTKVNTTSSLFSVDKFWPLLDLMANRSSRLLGQPPDLSAFNAPFPHRTGYEWLSRDDSEVDKYVSDKWCGFGLDLESAQSMYDASPRTGDMAMLQGIRKELPIYVFSGDLDPVGGPGGALVELVGKRYVDAGIKNVKVKLYKDGRHEMLNETNRDEVMDDFIAWVEEVVLGKQ